MRETKWFTLYTEFLCLWILDVVLQPLSCYSDLRHVKESQTKLRRASDDLDSALNKHVGAPKTKPLECDEAANQLLVCRSKFTAVSLEYAEKVSIDNLPRTSEGQNCDSVLSISCHGICRYFVCGFIQNAG